MSYKLRKFLCAVVLLIGLPLYIVAALYLVSLFERPSMAVELAVYVILGVLWALPLRALFRGIGRPDPDAPPRDDV